VETAKVLIEANADQTTRNKLGENILHALFARDPESDSDEEPDRNRRSLERMEALLQLIDRRLIHDLFRQRASTGQTGLTPLASFISRRNRDRDVVELMHRYMPVDVYTMFDGAGQTPIHQAIALQDPGLTATIADLCPATLMQENAMGQLPLELIYTAYLQHETSESPEPSFAWHRLRIGGTKWPTNTRPRQHTYKNRFQTIPYLYRVVQWRMENAIEQDPTLKRKVISLADAREVTRRLTERTLHRTGWEEDHNRYDEVWTFGQNEWSSS
jgi:hypothetical protein